MVKRPPPPRAILAAALALAAGLCSAAPASALTALTASRFDAGTIAVFDHSNALANNASVVRTGTGFLISDAAGDVVAEAPCVQNGTSAECPAGPTDRRPLVLDAGDT